MRSLRLLLAVCVYHAVSGCVVSEARYTRSRSAWDAEHTAHEDTARELHETERRLAEADSERSKLEAETGQQRAALNQATHRAEEGELDYENLDRTRDEQAMLLQELQSQAVLTEKQLSLLRQMLDEAQRHRDSLRGLEQGAAQSSALIRDLTLSLHDALTRHGADLDLHAGEPRVQLPKALLVDAEGSELSALGEQWLVQIAHASARYPLQAIELAEGFAPEPEQAAPATAPGLSGEVTSSVPHQPNQTPWDQLQAGLQRHGLSSVRYLRPAPAPASSEPQTDSAHVATDAKVPVVWLTLRLNSGALAAPEATSAD